MVILVICVVGIGAFLLGRSSGEPKISVVPTPTVVPEELQGFSCQSDSDCVLVINIKQCCSCPFVASKEELEKNKDLLKFPHLTLEVIPTPPGGCKDIVCSPCPYWSKAVCVSGICKETTEDQVGPITPTSDPTAGWKTYTNTKYGFSIKYPPNLVPKEEKALGEVRSVRFMYGMEPTQIEFMIEKNFIGGWMGKRDREKEIFIDRVRGTITLWLNCDSNVSEDWNKCIEQLTIENYDRDTLEGYFEKGNDKWSVFYRGWEEGGEERRRRNSKFGKNSCHF